MYGWNYNLSGAAEHFWSNFPVFVTAIFVAGLCGIIVGFERESRGKPAGLRTLVLICIGSAIYVQMSVFMTEKFGDPSRIAAQIVSGIGFLGAGAIFQQTQRGYIAGLTTAASIWTTAAIGMLAGYQKYIFAVIAALLVVLSLRVLRSVEKRVFHSRRVEGRCIFFISRKGKTEWRLRGQLEEHMLQPPEYRFKKALENEEKADGMLELDFNPKNKNHRGFLADIADWKEVTEIRK